MKRILLAATVLTLCACAITPEQKAKREEERLREAQNFQVALAAQCNPETASLMRRYFDQGKLESLSTEEQQSFRLRYVEQVNDPMFQACYRLAQENYAAQERIRLMQHYEDRYWMRPFPFYPFPPRYYR